ncbi:2-hydroxyacid dehydrogenase, partial [Thioclava sp. BHET1]
MSKPEILQIGPFPAWDQEPLDAAYIVHRYFEASDKAAFLAEVGPRIRAIVSSAGLGASREIIEACPQLELIAGYGVGYDKVDLEACRDHEVQVTNTPDVLTDDVADLAVGMALAFYRGILPGDAWVRGGQWAEGPMKLQRRMSGKRVGILGLGRIGAAIAKRLAAFDMPISYYSRAPKKTPDSWRHLADPVALARESDLLVVATAATPETQNIVDAKVLDALGPKGVLVNISRGSTIDEEALIAALSARRIAG